MIFIPNFKLTNRISEFFKFFIFLNLVFTFPFSILTVFILTHYYEDMVQNANENLLFRSKAFSFQLENSIKDRIYPSKLSKEFIKLNTSPLLISSIKDEFEIIRNNDKIFFLFKRDFAGVMEEWLFSGDFIIDKLLNSKFARPDETILIMNNGSNVGVSDSIENNFHITDDIVSIIESRTSSNFLSILQDKGSGQLVFSSSFPALPFQLVIIKKESYLYNSIRIQVLNYSLIFIILLILITGISIYISKSHNIQRREKSKFHSLFQNLPMGACLVDKEFNFIIQNNIWVDILQSDPNLWNQIQKEADFRTRKSSSTNSSYVWEMQMENIWEITLTPYFEDQDKTDGYTLILRDLSAKKLLFEHEMDLAKEIQEEYLPSEKNTINGLDFKVFYKPYFQVGGDYYDLIQIDNHKSLFVMADVVGHGMQAAMMMTVIKVLFLQIASTTEKPEDIILKMNSAVKENLPKGKTIVPFHFLILDTQNKLFTYCNAGHPGLIFFPDKSNRSYQVFEKMNPALGLPFDYPSNITVIQMPFCENSKFFLYTDGLVDVNNRTDSFGIENTLKFLLENRMTSPEDFSNKLWDRLLEYSSGEAFPDDITWFVIDSL